MILNQGYTLQTNWELFKNEQDLGPATHPLQEILTVLCWSQDISTSERCLCGVSVQWKTLVSDEPSYQSRENTLGILHQPPKNVGDLSLVAKLVLQFLLGCRKLAKTSLTFWIETNLPFSWKPPVFSIDHIHSSQLCIGYRQGGGEDQILVLADNLLQWVKHMNHGIRNIIIEMDKHPWVNGNYLDTKSLLCWV